MRLKKFEREILQDFVDNMIIKDIDFMKIDTVEKLIEDEENAKPYLVLHTTNNKLAVFFIPTDTYTKLKFDKPYDIRSLGITIGLH